MINKDSWKIPAHAMRNINFIPVITICHFSSFQQQKGISAGADETEKLDSENQLKKAALNSCACPAQKM